MNTILTKLKVSQDINLCLKVHELGSPMWIIVVHGLGEHKNRHEHFFKLFGEDCNIVTFDLRGHGESDGDRASIDSFDSFSSDLNKLIKYLQENYKLNEYVLFGHSMGGLISTRFVQSSPILRPKALFLSSPALGVSGIAKKALNIIPAGIVHKLATMKKGIRLKGILDLRKLSHNPNIYVDYINDPNCSLNISTKLLFKIIEESNLAHEQVFKIDIPVYGAIGSEDSLVDPEACVDFFRALSRSSELKVVDGAYHELHNEISDYSLPYLKFLKKTILSHRYYEN